MAGEIDFFKQFLFEAPGDDPPPDTAQASDDAPPDMPDDNGSNDSIDMDNPPDLPEIDADGVPPDIADDGGFDDGSFGADGETGEGDPGQDLRLKDLRLNEKISKIMNKNLYQRFLGLLGNIASRISEIKDNSDALYAITPDCADIVSELNKLETNIKLYLKDLFINEDYSKNFLFFNKCLNLLALLNYMFDDAINKGIKRVDI